MPEAACAGSKTWRAGSAVKIRGVVAVDEQLLGRVIDGAGKPIDGGGTCVAAIMCPLRGPPLNPCSAAP